MPESSGDWLNDETGMTNDDDENPIATPQNF
jgi:hypothetical protein